MTSPALVVQAPAVAPGTLAEIAATAGARAIVPVGLGAPHAYRLPGVNDDPAVLGEVTSWFNSRDSRFWGPLRALSYDRVAEIGFRPWGDDLIPRRFCSGRVLLNNGVYHRVD